MRETPRPCERPTLYHPPLCAVRLFCLLLVPFLSVCGLLRGKNLPNGIDWQPLVESTKTDGPLVESWPGRRVARHGAPCSASTGAWPCKCI